MFNLVIMFASTNMLAEIGPGPGILLLVLVIGMLVLSLFGKYMGDSYRAWERQAERTEELEEEFEEGNPRPPKSASRHIRMMYGLRFFIFVENGRLTKYDGDDLFDKLLDLVVEKDFFDEFIEYLYDYDLVFDGDITPEEIKTQYHEIKDKFNEDVAGTDD